MQEQNAQDRIVLVLDAMGVIFQAADDVAQLLLPFVAENGGLAEPDEVEWLYTRASLGQMTAAEFWVAAGVSPDVEDTYLARHRLCDGLIPFLTNLSPSVASVWCLSNDISEWSRKLRVQHGLERYFAGFVISGDVGCRKPDAAIYQSMLARAHAPANACIFVDDRAKNLDAARTLGLQTVRFGSRIADPPEETHPPVGSFAQLAEYMAAIRS